MNIISYNITHLLNLRFKNVIETLFYSNNLKNVGVALIRYFENVILTVVFTV